MRWALSGIALALSLFGQAVCGQAVFAAGSDDVIKRLSSAIQYPTVSYADHARIDYATFSAFQKFLKASFPTMYKHLRLLPVADHSLLFHWQGQDPSLKPVLFMAHQDVVPVGQADLEKWHYSPFSGAIAEGRVWGRGALDNKSGVMGWHEVIETLVSQGFQPKRDLYFAFGHDEEIGGLQGVRKMADYFKSQGISFEFVIDEGGIILDRVVPGVTRPIAKISIAEKGYLSLLLKVEAKGGHSMKPPPHTAVGILSQAIVRIENNPMPVRYEGATRLFFEGLSPWLGWKDRLVLTNPGLFRPWLVSTFEKTPGMNALVRTTAAATMFSGSDKDNILPTVATAVVNFRLLQGDSIEEVMAYVNEVINDERVQVATYGFSSEPSKIADVDGIGYRALANAIEAASQDEEMLILPGLVTGSTDSKHFSELTDNIYRFIGFKLTTDDISGFHGLNESIRIEEYQRVIKVYKNLLVFLNEEASLNEAM